ncbi:unnamed protein product [Symbiodinium sp. CCMP2592]|nr:unnamed protein product [Symbiodinium sp. CCMP2592]
MAMESDNFLENLLLLANVSRTVEVKACRTGKPEWTTRNSFVLTQFSKDKRIVLQESLPVSRQEEVYMEQSVDQMLGNLCDPHLTQRREQSSCERRQNVQNTQLDDGAPTTALQRHAPFTETKQLCDIWLLTKDLRGEWWRGGWKGQVGGWLEGGCLQDGECWCWWVCMGGTRSWEALCERTPVVPTEEEAAAAAGARAGIGSTRSCEALCERTPVVPTEEEAAAAAGARVTAIRFPYMKKSDKYASEPVPATKHADVLQLEDLRRHQQSSTHVMALEKMQQGVPFSPAPRGDVENPVSESEAFRLPSSPSSPSSPSKEKQPKKDGTASAATRKATSTVKEPRLRATRRAEVARKKDAAEQEKQLRAKIRQEIEEEMAEQRKTTPLGQAVSKATARKASMTEKNMKIKTQEEAFSLRHGKFVTDGGVQEFVYIPATDASEISAKSGELFESILRHWNLQRPHLLIKFQSGFAHPKRLMDEKEMDKLANTDFNSEIYQYYDYFRECVDNDSDVTEAIDKKRKKLEEERDKLEKQKAQNQKTLDTHQGTPASSPKEAGDSRQKEAQFLSEDEEKEDDEKNNAGAQRKSQDSKTSYDRLEALKDELKNLDAQVRKEKTLALLNDFLYGSLSNLIDVIVRACVRNRCWILVEGGPNGGLLLLKQAAERCLEKPTILVMDSLKKSRYPYEDVRKFVEAEDEDGKELRQALKMNGHHMSELVEKGPADKKQVKIIADKMAAQKMEKMEREKEEARKVEGEAMEKASVKSGASRGEKSKKEQREWTLKDQEEVDAIRVESALMTARLLENTQPINQPVVTPMKLGRKFWDMDSEKKGWTCKTAKDPEAGKVRWNQWHFRGGTHYILCDDHHHALVLHSLAPSGCIFLGGGDSSKKELLKMLVNGHPVVCLNNTGRLTQEFVRCHDFLCAELFRMAKRDEDASSTRNATKGTMLKRSPRSELLQVPKKEKSDYLKDNIKKKSVFKTLTFDGDLGIVERKGLVFNMQKSLKEVTEFTQPELCELFLTYLRRGLQITKLCVVMDPLNPRECSGGHTEDKLTKCRLFAEEPKEDEPPEKKTAKAEPVVSAFYVEFLKSRSTKAPLSQHFKEDRFQEHWVVLRAWEEGRLSASEQHVLLSHHLSAAEDEALQEDPETIFAKRQTVLWQLMQAWTKTRVFEIDTFLADESKHYLRARKAPKD